MRFSIIIPVYNVEKYIRKCMDSVMNQTFRDYEVIVVDDESPDNSMQIVEEYAEKFPGMITMIHQKNTRQGGARNRGVREARGEYLIFIDSDDYVSLNMLAFLDQKLCENPCDIFVFFYEMVSVDGTRMGAGGCGDLPPGIYYPLRDKQILQLPANPANKVFHREFYVNSGVEFPEKLLYEDMVLRLLYVKASKVVLCEEILYYYVQSSNSSIRRNPSQQMLDILTMSDMVIDMFQKEGLYKDYQTVLEASLIGSIVYILDVINEVNWRSPLQNCLDDYIKSHFLNYAENPYLDEDVRRSLKILEKRDYKFYNNRVIVPRKIKKWLNHCSALRKLNQLRKKISGKKG